MYLRGWKRGRGLRDTRGRLNCVIATLLVLDSDGVRDFLAFAEEVKQ